LAKSFNENEFCFVNPAHGQTPGMARITKVHGIGAGAEADIVYDNGKSARFYTAHLFRNAESMKATTNYRLAHGISIGMKNRLKV
jgi:hypothetical protein